MSREYKVLHGSPESVQDELNSMEKQYDLVVSGMAVNAQLGTLTVVICRWPTWDKLVIPKPSKGK